MPLNPKSVNPHTAILDPASGPGATEAAQPQVELRTYFPTPVAVVTLPDAPALNAALRTAVLAREQTEPSTAHSNLGGWQSDWMMESWGGPALVTVLNTARALATRLTADRTGRAVKIAWKTNAWANVNRSGHGNEFHTHPGSYWSGTYYVDDGGIADNPDLGGAFELQDPRGVAPAMYAPNLAFNFPAGLSVGVSELITPKAGTMLMFPAWLSHAVRPYTGDQTRISVAFNLSV